MGLVKGHISQPFFYPFLLICLINFSFNNLLLTIIYQIYLYFNVFLMVFRLLSPFLILVGRNALKMGSILGVFGGKETKGDFFLWFFLFKKGDLPVLYIKSNVSGFFYLFHDFSVGYS